MSEWVDEPKTGESSPITPEEMREVQQSLYDDDVSGGLQNITVPEEEMERIREQEAHAKSFIDMCDQPRTPCYKTDRVTLKLSPENLVVLQEILQNYSLNMKKVEYMEQEFDFSLYEQQLYVQIMHEKVEQAINEYVKHRPYTPLLKPWVKKIGKEEVRKGD